jgi:hypothetical protein
MHPDDLERLAELVADRLRDALADNLGLSTWHSPASSAQARELVDVKTVAAALGVARSFVYEHAVALGGRKLGNGPKARWRFDLDQARQAFDAPSHPSPSPAPHRRRRMRPATTAAGVALLPLRGHAE